MSGNFSKAKTPQRYSISQVKIRCPPYSASALVLIRSQIGGCLKAGDAPRKSDEGRVLQCITVYADGKYGYARDGKPACPIWSDHLRLARKDERTQEAYPIILGLSFANHPTFMVYPFDLTMAHRSLSAGLIKKA